MIRTLARRTLKVTFYFFLSLVVGHTLGPADKWFNYDWATHIGHVIYGSGEIGADNFYDLYFYIDVVSVVATTTAIYLITMKLISKIRSK